MGPGLVLPIVLLQKPVHRGVQMWSFPPTSAAVTVHEILSKAEPVQAPRLWIFQNWELNKPLFFNSLPHVFHFSNANRLIHMASFMCLGIGHLAVGTMCFSFSRQPASSCGFSVLLEQDRTSPTAQMLFKSPLAHVHHYPIGCCKLRGSDQHQQVGSPVFSAEVAGKERRRKVATFAM